MASIITASAKTAVGTTIRNPRAPPWTTNPEIRRLFNIAAISARLRISSPSDLSEQQYKRDAEAFFAAVARTQHTSWQHTVSNLGSSSSPSAACLHWHLVQAPSEAFDILDFQPLPPTPPCSSPHEPLNAFCRYFASVSQSPQDPSFDSSFQQHADEQMNALFASLASPSVLDAPPADLPVFNSADVASMTARLKRRSAPGPDRVANRFLKHGGPALHSAMSSFFNLLLRCAYIPQSWKEATSCPYTKAKAARAARKATAPSP